MPKTAFLELRDELEAAHSATAVKSAVKTFANRLGYCWFAHLSACGSEVNTISNYPRPWQILYHAEGYADLDPVVMAAINANHVFAWDEAMLSLDANHQQRRFLAAAREFGIRAGTSIPVVAGFQRTSLFTLATSQRYGGCAISCPALAATVATLVDVHALRCRVDEPPHQGVRLTAREKTCLNWAARGNKDAETARILGKTERTVEFHLRNARRKLEAENRTHAVALAIRQGII